jgi:precorrin-6B methylase 2
MPGPSVSFTLPAAAMLTLLACAAVAQERKPQVEFFPTPQEAVDVMLEMAGVTASDYLIDLGSGDGRIPITAARKYGARALGVEIVPELVATANTNAREAGVVDKVRFKQQDLFATDIESASVVTMFLLGSINLKLRPRLLQELKPGTRVLSYNFNMGDWKPDRVERVNGRPIYLWIIPER